MGRIVLLVSILTVLAQSAFASHTLPFATLKWSGGYSPVQSATLEMFNSGVGQHTTAWHKSKKAQKLSVEHRWQFVGSEVKDLAAAIKASGICSLATGTVYGAGKGHIIMDAGTVEIAVNLPGCKKSASYNPASGKDKMPAGLTTLRQALDKLSATVTSKVLGTPGCQ
jgi:hypothetical protein